ncbi:MAG: flagellin, partial [Planctomycetota bacterium]|nr:flagellin [Planctomycetota bacterium]
TIDEERRRFEPPALLYNTDNDLGINDSNGKAVQLYLDFSQVDPTVEAKINNLGNPSTIVVEFNATTNNITISADALNGTGATPPVIAPVEIPIDSKNLTTGFYITDPNLKGLFIKASSVINAGKSVSNGESLDITAYGGSELMEVNTYATNPRKNTSEELFNFLGGMQYQLGNTEGDQDRTVYSIQSMVMANVGRMTWDGVEYCLQDVLGGGVASLSRDPILAMRIVSQAVDDVSTLRARLGAFQKNMLQTNINSLNVAIENITKTESAIRDTDMAKESTEFTRNQIMVQAGTSMLAQANQVTQNVLSLLSR